MIELLQLHHRSKTATHLRCHTVLELTLLSLDSDVTWTDTTLDTYLQNPRAYIPGTKMVFRGIKKNTDRTSMAALGALGVVWCACIV
jgi:cytochrome c2